MRHRTGKYTVCRRVRVSFSPEIVRVGAGVNSCLKLEQPLWKTQIVNIASPLERRLICLIAKGLGEDSKSSGRFFCAELLPVIFNCWIAKGSEETLKALVVGVFYYAEVLPVIFHLLDCKRLR